MSAPHSDFAEFMQDLSAYAADTYAINFLDSGNSHTRWTLNNADTFTQAAQILLGYAKSAHHLCINNMNVVPEATYDDEFLRSPYPSMLIFMHVHPDNKATYDDMLLVHEDEDERCTIIFPFVRLSKGSAWIPYMYRMRINWDADNKFIADARQVYAVGNTKVSTIAVGEIPGVSIAEMAEDALQDSASHHFHVANDILTLINCMNVELEAVEPSRLKIARAKKKGEQIERYSTIKLPGNHATGKGTTGGSHASPAMHTRRGHYRRHRTDHEKRSWVRPCVVGDLGEGLIHGEYKV